MLYIYWSNPTISKVSETVRQSITHMTNWREDGTHVGKTSISSRGTTEHEHICIYWKWLIQFQLTCWLQPLQ